MSKQEYIVRSQINPRMIFCTDGEFHADIQVGVCDWMAKVYKTKRGAQHSHPGRIVWASDRKWPDAASPEPASSNTGPMGA